MWKKKKKVTADVIKLRILRWTDTFGFSQYDLNTITGVLIRERQREI